MSGNKKWFVLGFIFCVVAINFVVFQNFTTVDGKAVEADSPAILPPVDVPPDYCELRDSSFVDISSAKGQVQVQFKRASDDSIFILTDATRMADYIIQKFSPRSQAFEVVAKFSVPGRLKDLNLADGDDKYRFIGNVINFSDSKFMFLLRAADSGTTGRQRYKAVVFDAKDSSLVTLGAASGFPGDAVTSFGRSRFVLRGGGKVPPILVRVNSTQGLDTQLTLSSLTNEGRFSTWRTIASSATEGYVADAMDANGNTVVAAPVRIANPQTNISTLTAKIWTVTAGVSEGVPDVKEVDIQSNFVPPQNMSQNLRNRLRSSRLSKVSIIGTRAIVLTEVLSGVIGVFGVDVGAYLDPLVRGSIFVGSSPLIAVEETKFLVAVQSTNISAVRNLVQIIDEDRNWDINFDGGLDFGPVDPADFPFTVVKLNGRSTSIRETYVYPFADTSALRFRSTPNVDVGRGINTYRDPALLQAEGLYFRVLRPFGTTDEARIQAAKCGR